MGSKQWGIQTNIVHNTLITIVLPISVKTAFINLANINYNAPAPEGTMSLYVYKTGNAFQVFKDWTRTSVTSPMFWLAMGNFKDFLTFKFLSAAFITGLATKRQKEKFSKTSSLS